MSVLDRGAEILRAARIESPRAEAQILLAHALGCRREDIVAGVEIPDASALVRYERLLDRRAAHEPMAYILGRREFWSLDFATGPGALVPRPETEILLEQSLRAFPEKNAALDVLDLGTGTGCLLLSFLSERPSAQGVGVDASADALVWAARNTQALKLADRVRLIEADWSALPEASFDVVFANPPYIETQAIAALAPDVAAYEPRSALDGGHDGLAAYRSLAAALPRLLHAAGIAFVEIGQGQSEMVSEIFSQAGLHVAAAVPDLAGIPRCLIAMPAVPEVK